MCWSSTVIDQHVQGYRRDYSDWLLVAIAFTLQFKAKWGWDTLITIVDFDLIWVMDHVAIVESGRPADLLQDPDSWLKVESSKSRWYSVGQCVGNSNIRLWFYRLFAWNGLSIFSSFFLSSLYLSKINRIVLIISVLQSRQRLTDDFREDCNLLRQRDKLQVLAARYLQHTKRLEDKPRSSVPKRQKRQY